LDPVIAPAAVTVLGELIAAAVAASAGRTWKSVKGKPEGRALKAAIDAALTGALRDAALPAGAVVDEAWVAEVARLWRPAFTSRHVSAELVACIGDPARGGERLARLASRVLEDAGCDLVELGRAFWVDEFLGVLPRRLFECLTAGSLEDDGARGLVDHLLRQRADARARGVEPATPREFAQDLTALLRGLDVQARTGRLPPYLPPHADVTALARTVRVRPGVRPGLADPDAEDPRSRIAGRAYRLPADRPEASGPPRPWPDVAAGQPRLMVLADPGLGKSWLIRTETHRLAAEALARLDADPAAVIIPVQARCDQLAAAPGGDLADKAVAHLADQRLLPERSRAALAAKVRVGQVVLLLDALDELPTADIGPLRDLVRSWADQVGDRARCVITSRIAGYTGSPLPDASEVELQPFTPGDVRRAVAAWQLPAPAARQLMDRAADPAIAAMTRIPLLLALLCSLTTQLPPGQGLPRTRGQLYDRVLRWFLTQAHRSADNPATPALDDIEVGGLLELLAPMAFTFAGQDDGWIDLMPADRLLAAIRAAGPAFTERRRPASQVLRELSVGAGILVPVGDPSAGRSPSYLFLHRTIAEYLVARHLATLPAAHWLTIVDQHRWFDPDWAEVIPMLGEQLTPAAAATLIRHFLADEADPFHHSLLTALGIWGARPDADHLLPASTAAQLTEQAGQLIRHKHTRQAITSRLTAMAYLPQALLAHILRRLGDGDQWVRRAAADALAGRDDPAVTAALLDCLGDDDEFMRRAAVRALAGRDDPAVTAALLDHLRDDHVPVRRAAADALAGRDDPAVTAALLDHLGDDDEDVRRAAAQALAGRDDPAFTAALLDHLRSDDASVRHLAVLALAGRDDPAVTTALLDHLRSDDNEFMRGAAARALAGQDDPAVTAALLDHLRDDHGPVRYQAVQALAGRDDPAVTAALLDHLRDDHGPVRYEAVRALASRDDPAVTTALLDRLRDEEWDVRYEAVRALASRDDPAVTAALLDHVRDDDGAGHYEAVQALARRDDPAVTAALLDRLRDDHVPVRRAAVRALAGRRDPAVTAALLDHLRSDDESVRYFAVLALAGRDDPAVTAALLDHLRSDDESMRGAAADALAGRDDPAVTAALLDRLGDDDEHVRHTTVLALAGRDDPAVTAALLDHLRSENEPVRGAAARALVGRDDPAVTAALLDHLRSDDESMRHTAVQALADRDSPQDLLALSSQIRRLSQSSLLQVIDAAEQLMTRHYRRIEPAEQAAVRAAMGWLTATALTDNSA